MFQVQDCTLPIGLQQKSELLVGHAYTSRQFLQFGAESLALFLFRFFLGGSSASPSIAGLLATDLRVANTLS